MRRARRHAAAALRREQGFGLVELLIAMTVLSVGIVAVFSLLLSSELAIQRASASTTAMSALDVRMEALRSARFTAIGHTTSLLTASDSTYKADPVYRAANPDDDATYNETNEAVTLTTSTLTPTSTVNGADGRPYRVDLYLTWVAVTGGRNVKQVTVVVRDSASSPTPYRTRARATATFDQASAA